MHAISGLFGNQRGRHDPTVVAFFVEIAIEPVATGAGFIDEDEAFRLRLELTSEVIDIRVSCADGPEGDDVGVVIFGNLVEHFVNSLQAVSAYFNVKIMI